ncbi:MAG: rod-binding protein [Candidatus Riflebacteria bacterium]|nr:rod-binding protein [Candidatus Riflebacteria bacterium]
MADLKIGQGTFLPLTNVKRGSRPVREAELTPEKKKELSKLKSACKDFESLFTYQLMKEMRKTVNQTGLIHGGQGEDVFSDMLDQERAKSMSLGLGDMLYSQLSRVVANSIPAVPSVSPAQPIKKE